MFRIGIIGSDNSHADAFSKLLNIGLDPDDPQSRMLIPQGTEIKGGIYKPFPEFCVSAIYGTDPKRTEEVAAAGRIPKIVDSPEEMFREADGVMVVWRHGGLHAQYAMPFIKAGVATWIDKPFAIAPADARELFAQAEKSRAVVAGGSTVKYTPGVLECKKLAEEAGKDFKGGSMTYAVSLKNEYGNAFFYGSHLTECALEVFGYDPGEVYAYQTETSITAVLGYGGYSAALHYVTDNYKYRVMLHIGSETEYRSFDIPGSYYYGFEQFARAVEAGRTLVEPEKMIKAVDVLDAVVRSAESGRPIKL